MKDVWQSVNCLIFLNMLNDLSQMLADETQLEAWVQAKLTKAADYIKTVKHYVEYGMEEGAYDQVMPQMEPEMIPP